jgi:hypothetical protein
VVPRPQPPKAPLADQISSSRLPSPNSKPPTGAQSASPQTKKPFHHQARKTSKELATKLIFNLPQPKLTTRPSLRRFRVTAFTGKISKCTGKRMQLVTVVRGQVRHLPADELIKVGKLNLADAKIREYSSKFSFSPCKTNYSIFFSQKFKNSFSQKFGFYFLNYFFADHVPRQRYTPSVPNLLECFDWNTIINKSVRNL